MRTQTPAVAGRAPSSSPCADRRRAGGFTLVELLVVIVILGTLAGIVVFAVGRATSKAATNACKADVRTVADALEAWRAQNGAYPNAGAAGQAQLSTGPNALLRKWPSSTQYTIALDPAVAGQVNVTLPGGTPLAAGGAVDPCESSASDSVAAESITESSTTTSSSTTSSTSTTSTTTAPVSNGVTVTPSVSPATNPWFGENQLTLTNSAPITALNVAIHIAKTPGVAYQGQYVTFWGGTVNSGHSTSGTTVDYTFTNAPSATIVAGSWLLAAQFSGTGTPRVTSGDTWTVTTTSGGLTSTLTGTF